MSELYQKFFKSGGLLPINRSLQSLLAEYPFKITVNKSRRARRITLRVCQITAELRITTPLNLNTATLRNFINTNMAWIELNRARVGPQLLIANGASLPVFGVNRTILVDPNMNEGYRLTKTQLTLPKTTFLLKNQIKNLLIQLAESYFTENCDRFSDMLGVRFARISLKDPRSRWGSCSSDKKLMFSWRLIMAPVEVSSYVAAHEIVHLIHMNHSKNFWKAVALIYPNYNYQRDWLTQNGRNLHKFIF